MYDEEERRQELLRRRAIRRRHKMREKRRRVRRRRFMLSVLVAAIVLFCLIRLGLLAYSAIHSRIDKTEQQAEQTEQTQSEKQTEQTESSYSMAIITTAAGLNVRTGPGTAYPRVTTLSGGTILSTDAEKDNWSQIAEGNLCQRLAVFGLYFASARGGRPRDRDKERQSICGTVCGKFPNDCTAGDRGCRSAAVFRKGWRRNVVRGSNTSIYRLDRCGQHPHP